MTPASAIAHYRITSKLGEGGMGAVYRATDTKLNREVAIKMLPPALADDAAHMQRFEREAQVLAALNHPNIAAIYGIETGAIVMELVEGPELAGPLPIDTAIAYARQIATALEAAHEKGIIHRDLKPSNVKVTADGTIKVLDFGLAKASEQSAVCSTGSPATSPTLSLAMTQAGMIVGTAAYMSPEQARGKPVDKRADIWAFGVVLYELITGRRLFEGEDISQTMAAVILQEPSYDGIPARLHPLFKSCLEKDPKKRLRDIGDVWRLIGDDAPAPVAVVPKTRQGALKFAVACAAVTTVAAAGLAFVHFSEKPRRAEVTRFTIGLSDLNLWSTVISPDGRHIVNMVNSPGQSARLSLRSLDMLEPRDLPGTEGANFPFWSPDSRYVGFFVGARLKTVDTHGGPPHTVTAAAARSRGGAWSTAGIILFSADGSTLQQIPASGGTSSRSTATSLPQMSPTFLPDGQHFLFASQGQIPEADGIYVSSVDSGHPDHRKPRRILPDVSRTAFVPRLDAAGSSSDAGTLLFVREATLMGAPFDSKALKLTGDIFPVAERIGSTGFALERFSASVTGTLIYHLQDPGNRVYTWYDQQGKVLRALGGKGQYGSISLSPDGSQLAGDGRPMAIPTSGSSTSCAIRRRA
jgi:serine/threonine protein kinase